jgi:hypothetical protein
MSRQTSCIGWVQLVGPAFRTTRPPPGLSPLDRKFAITVWPTGRIEMLFQSGMVGCPLLVVAGVYLARSVILTTCRNGSLAVEAVAIRTAHRLQSHCRFEEMFMAVNTAKVDGRRKLDYASLEELLADADRLSSGPVKELGNWSAGQIFKHLATAYNGSIDGFTMTFRLPLRVMAKLFKKKLIAGPMPAGFNLPAGAAKAVVPEAASIQEGLADLHTAVARLNREPRRAKHPMFGEISKDEWNTIHLKHANLHMSFLIPAT